MTSSLLLSIEAALDNSCCERRASGAAKTAPAKQKARESSHEFRSKEAQRYFLRRRLKLARLGARSQQHWCLFAASVKMGSGSKNKYSVILPTYNERQNLPVLVQMLHDVFTKE